MSVEQSNMNATISDDVKGVQLRRDGCATVLATVMEHFKTTLDEISKATSWARARTIWNTHLSLGTPRKLTHVPSRPSAMPVSAAGNCSRKSEKP